jgi:hypothetical protein
MKTEFEKDEGFQKDEVELKDNSAVLQGSCCESIASIPSSVTRFILPPSSFILT